MAVRFMSNKDQNLVAIPDSFAVSFTMNVPVDTNIFTADGPCEVIAVREVHSGTAASATVDVKKCTGTTAPASGTTILASTFACDSTANTVVTKNAASGLSATLANRKLDAGDRLSLDVTGTLTGFVGSLTIYLKRLQTAGGDR